jgi:hypothetical protein
MTITSLSLLANLLPMDYKHSDILKNMILVNCCNLSFNCIYKHVVDIKMIERVINA